MPALFAAPVRPRSAAVRGLGMAVALSMFAETAVGQVSFQWAAPADGSWTDAARWSPAQSPDAPQHNALLGFMAPYTVTIPGGSVIELVKLEIPNPDVTLRVSPSTEWPLTLLQMGSGGILNNGTIAIEGGGTTVKGSELVFAHDADISGSGTIRLIGLNASILSYTGAIIGNGPDHTIAGQGRVEDIFNEGLIHANQPGVQLKVYGSNAGLILADQPGGSLSLDVMNSGTIRVENGAKATGGGFSIGSERGRYIATGTGSSLGLGIDNGILETLNGAEYSSPGATLKNCRVETEASIRSAALEGAFGNDGVVYVHRTLTMKLGDASKPLELTGSGVMRMTGVQALLKDVGASVNHATHTIAGIGFIDGGGGGVDWEPMVNEGRISADVPGSVLRLWLLDNYGVLEAINGGILQCDDQSGGMRVMNAGLVVAHAGSTIQESSIQQTSAGVTRVDGGLLKNVAIRGGLIETVNGGVMRDGGISDATFRGTIDVIKSMTVLGNVTLETNMDIPAGAILFARGMSKPTYVTGQGVIRLLDRTSSRLAASNLKPSTFGTGIEICGSGNLFGGGNSPLHIECVVSPGLEDGLIGQFEAAGTFLGLSAETVMDIASATETDTLIASGELAIDGTLRVRLPSAYVPEPCTEFVLISTTGTGSLTGQFHTLDLPEMPLGRMNVRYDPGAVILVYSPADYDGSTFVDTDDFTAFVMDFEAGNDAADFNHSGFVDGDDFTDFVAAFEQGC